jgi:hypothetical protein
MTRIAIAGGFAAFALVAATAWGKLPPPPPLDEKGKAAAEEKKAKDAAAAEKAKADQAAAEDYAVKNYQGNMKKAGKPIPKPVAMAAKSEPPKGADAKPQANTAAEKKTKDGEKAPQAPAKDAAKKP